MKKIYLDHNLYIYSLTDERLRNNLNNMKTSFQVVYSPAHIEEIFKAYMDNPDMYEDNKKSLFSIISQVTDNNEVLPSDTLICANEAPEECYKRVAGTDTRNRVISDSKTRFNVDKANRQALVKKDRQYCSLSNEAPEKIWDKPFLVECIRQWNVQSSQWIKSYNNSLDIIVLLLQGIDKRIPQTFRFERKNYAVLKNSHTQLELTIEILFRVLNYFGYCSETKDKTSISGTHDVTHAIYATATDFLVTTDKNFAKKSAAVYSFLNAETRVILCKPSEINEFLETKLDKILVSNIDKEKYLIIS